MTWLEDTVVVTSEQKRLKDEAWAMADLRRERDVALLVVDKYQGVLYYATLAQQQQDELSAYRIALLDAPEAMVMPTVPEWMV